MSWIISICSRIVNSTVEAMELFHKRDTKASFYLLHTRFNDYVRAFRPVGLMWTKIYRRQDTPGGCSICAYHMKSEGKLLLYGS